MLKENYAMSDEEERRKCIETIGQVVDIEPWGYNVFLADHLPPDLCVDNTADLHIIELSKLKKIKEIVEVYFNIRKAS